MKITPPEMRAMIEAMWERMAPEEQNRFEEMAARHRRRRDERNDEMRAEAWGDRRFLQTVLTQCASRKHGKACPRGCRVSWCGAGRGTLHARGMRQQLRKQRSALKAWTMGVKAGRGVKRV